MVPTYNRRLIDDTTDRIDGLKKDDDDSNGKKTKDRQTDDDGLDGLVGLYGVDDNDYGVRQVAQMAYSATLGIDPNVLLYGAQTKVGMHKIQLKLDLGLDPITGKRKNPEEIEDIYNERLGPRGANIPIVNNSNGKKNNNEKRVEKLIDGYRVTCSFYYPSGTVNIMISCSKNPFRIYINDPERTGRKFIILVAQIRQFLCTILSDPRGVLVPQIMTSDDPLSRWKLNVQTLILMSLSPAQ